MRFTPYSFLGAAASTTTSFTITNAVSGTFASGSDTYGYVKFTGSGQLDIINGVLLNANIFLVGGGSGASTNLDPPELINGFGGAGGGLLFTSSITLNAGLYIINVGEGGAQNLDGGSSSVFCDARKISVGVDGGNKNGTSGFPSYNVKGAYGLGSAGAAGGGGGLGSVGQDGSTVSSFTGGNGGSGLEFNILGSSSFWGAGGGGGGCSTSLPQNGTGGTGGSGIGGNGESTSNGNTFGGTAGTPNTGAGGGGEAKNSGNSRPGGSGIVIITYKL
jgi:hypothetical protein